MKFSKAICAQIARRKLCCLPFTQRASKIDTSCSGNRPLRTYAAKSIERLDFPLRSQVIDPLAYDLADIVGA